MAGDDILSSAIETLTALSQDESAPAHLRLGATNSLIQLAQKRAEAFPSQEVSDFLTDDERQALRDLLPWAWDPWLWMPDQIAVLVKLGVYTKAEIRGLVKEAEPRRLRERKADDQLAARRGRRKAG